MRIDEGLGLQFRDMNIDRGTFIVRESTGSTSLDWPDAASLAALRAWYEGMPSRDAVAQYLGDPRDPGESSRSMIGRVKRRLIAIATNRGPVADATWRRFSVRPGLAKRRAHGWPAASSRCFGPPARRSP